jgi:outer membrane protein
MKLFSKFFLITFFLILSTNNLKAKDKVAYLDIDFILTNTIAGKTLLTNLQKQEEVKINQFRTNDEKFKDNEKKILSKKNIVSDDELNKEMRELQINFKKYNKNKKIEIENLKKKRNKNIINFINLINPIIEKYMTDNSIYMLIDKKNVFIANKDYDITNNLIELINNQIKNIEIK